MTPVKGGQGRSDDEVERDAGSIIILIALAGAKAIAMTTRATQMRR